MKKQIIIALATLTALPAVSQEKWDLRKCIDYAIEHNLSIKQQEAARDQNAVDLNTAKYSRLPNLNGNVGQSFNFGRALQADNTYGDRNTKNTNFSLSTSIPLFTGSASAPVHFHLPIPLLLHTPHSLFWEINHELE